MAKKFKLRIPKRVAGVKIPRIVRKGPVAKFLNSSAGQLVLAEALVVVGGALAAEARGSGSGPAELGREPLSGVSKGGGERADTRSESSMLPSAFNDAVRAFRTSVEQHLSKERDTTQEGATADTGEVQSESARPKKKAASSPIETPSMPH
ncbi:MAG: hypothetical protein JWM63_4483 [Gammaproteobacteria bacterium]|jgi:hypothetical protein|nr:hypothetical protein [Gammaproteobacteria bacterium]